MRRAGSKRQPSLVACQPLKVDRQVVQNAPPPAPPAPPPPATGRLRWRTRPAKHQPGTGQHDAVHRRPRQQVLAGGRARWRAGKAEKTDAPELRSHSRRWAPLGRLVRAGRRPSVVPEVVEAAVARGGGPREQQARPTPCVTGSSSPDEQTSAPSFAQRLTAGLGAVAPGIGVTASGCTAMMAADTPDRRLPPPETPPAPQRSLLSGLVHANPERSRGGADDSASLAEALRAAARRHLPPGAEHVLIKAPGLEPLQPAPPREL